MSRRSAFLAACAMVVLGATVPGLTQISLQQTPPPFATAENESWYQSAEPISLNGRVYYPSGPIKHFSRNEMVPIGMFERVPIYKKTTEEPGSIVYVPLPGGLVRPYEQRRTGDLAGTVGSTSPSFPVALPSAPAQATPGAEFVQVPWAPSFPTPVGTSAFAYSRPGPEAGPAPVGTTGAGRPTHLETVQRPIGLNDVFVEFQKTKWFASGPAVEFDPGRFTQIGEHHGFAVYREGGRPNVIFLPSVIGSPTLVVPYTSR
jgi:hypothetical protein